MKKKMSLLGVLGLVLSLSFSTPSLSEAATSSITLTPTSNIVPSQSILAHSQFIRHTVTYNGNVTPPSTYYYNKDGWRGTLNRFGYNYFPGGNVTQGYYEGTVYCDANCGMSITE